MNRRKFVLSWGRKIFFGMSWPLTSLIGLVYLKSYIIPQSPTDVVYFLATYIGHYGFLNALVYFLLYAPIALLMPSYYISRFWSLFLILALNLLVLIDGIIFSSYFYHSYSFILNLLMEGGLKYFPDRSTLTILVPCGIIFISVVLWIRGELIWRSMQRRFSNPVKNWYLVLILICLMISHGLFLNGGVHEKMANLFPLNFTFGKSDVVDNAKFYYPLSTVECSSKENKNFIFFVVKNWNESQFNEVDMPHVWAMQKHAQVFATHYSASSDPAIGELTLEYSVPGNYLEMASKKESVLMKELKKRQYEISKFNTIEAFNNWVSNRPSDDIQPFFTYVVLDHPANEVDSMILNAINLLQKENHLSGTHIVMTGAYAGNELSQVPFLMMTTERKSARFEHLTTHYDVVPTLMDQEFGCKKTYQNASIGTPLKDQTRDWIFLSKERSFKVLDFKTLMFTSFDGSKLDHGTLGTTPNRIRKNVIFESLKLRSKFSRPR